MMIWRFRRLIEAYGADPARWPAGERARAEALLVRSERARRRLAEAQAFDAVLMADAKPAADERLIAAVIARATAEPQQRQPAQPREFRLDWSLARLWPQAVGLAAAGVLGFVVGWTDLLPPAPGDDTVDLIDFLDAGGADGDTLL
jgi:hypothetical protein